MMIWQDFKLVAILISAAWCLSEIILTIVTHSKSDKSKEQDRSTLRRLWLTIIPCVFLGAYLGARGIGYIATGHSVISIAGMVFILVGLAIRWTAVLTLKAFFSSNVHIQVGHQLINKGIYKIIRHPAYAGSLTSFAGLGMTFSNWLSSMVIFVPILFAFLHRIKIEEQALVGHFGNDYIHYCEKTKRFIPKIY